MHPLRSIRRVALGAAVTGAAIGAVPAMASAASTCLYNPTSKQVFIEENSPGARIAITRVGSDGDIAFTDGGPDYTICTNQVDFFTVTATVSNTDRINVSSKGTSSKVIQLEELGPGATPESDGVSEIETLVTTSSPNLELNVLGSLNDDGIRVGAAGINLGLDVNASDNDVDIRTTSRPRKIRIYGRKGDDGISGRGNFFNPVPTDVPLTIDGGDGNDFVEGGLGRDSLRGGDGSDINGNDRLRSNDGQFDEVFGGPGFDTAITDVTEQLVLGIEQRTAESVGRLRLAPRVVKTEAGTTARLEMSWMHPKAWRELRKVELSVYRGKKAVGMINARPASGRLTDIGAVELMKGSKLGHHGKWVTAKLAMRLPKSLAGEDLRVAVRATDRHGHKQLEPSAGLIRVAE